MCVRGGGDKDISSTVHTPSPRSKAVIWVQFLLNVIWRRCRILYSIVIYLYVSCSGIFTSVGEQRANLSAIVYL